MTQETALTPVQADTMEQVVIGGDLGSLTPKERLSYYRRVCESMGLNPFTKPFAYIRLNGRLQLYASKDCTEQLRKLNGISITDMELRAEDGIFIATVSATDSQGRTDQATGAVALTDKMTGDERANAMMKAETKAKRRVTLSLSGLGWLDESEQHSIPGSSIIDVDTETGEIAPPQGPRQPLGSVPELMLEAKRLWGRSANEVCGAIGVEHPREIEDPNDALRQLRQLWGDS